MELVVHQRKTRAFVVDAKTHYIDVKSEAEAHYLCAMLNADAINQVIKPYQSQGLMEPRDVHRTAFEACGVPLLMQTMPIINNWQVSHGGRMIWLNY